MDNRAQISVEYLIIVAVLLVISAVVTLMATGLISTSQGLSEIKDNYLDKAKAMLR
jgi:uncharacterized protein (UPF0333 family)